MAMSEAQGLTAERVRELLDYCKETGLFRWRRTLGSRARQGEPAGGAARSYGYALIRVDGVLYRAHRLAWLHTTGAWPDAEVDHRDGVRDNNAWSNLRDVSAQTNRENQRGARSNNRGSDLIGAHYCARTGRWMARIATGGKTIHLGRHDTPEKAHEAYVKAKRELHAGGTL